MVKRRSILNLIFVLCVFGFFQTMVSPCHAGMNRLSEIQDGIFHLRPKLLTSDTDKTDRYIDDEQAGQIAELSRVEPYTPADEDYPFSLVDSLLLDTDLVIDRGFYSGCFLCAKTRYGYLSRNNYSPSSFTGEKKPPEVFIRRIRAKEPIYGEEIEGVSTTVTDRRLHGDMHHTVKSTWPYPYGRENTGYTGEVEGVYVHVIHSCYTVWHDDIPPVAGTCFKDTLLNSGLQPGDNGISRVVKFPSYFDFMNTSNCPQPCLNCNDETP